MKVFKYREPYTPDGKTTYPETINRSGVYVIKRDGVVCYVGHSKTNLYKTMYRHFQSWKDKTQVRVSYATVLNQHKFTVRIIYATPAQADRLEKYLILKLVPTDNPNNLAMFSPSEMEGKRILDTGNQYENTEVSWTPF